MSLDSRTDRVRRDGRALVSRGVRVGLALYCWLCHERGAALARVVLGGGNHAGLAHRRPARRAEFLLASRILDRWHINSRRPARPLQRPPPTRYRMKNLA